ncbi:unknown protein [Desulfotalea psychrophila LSv54]|uniref:Uncharacterized protein n=1 Tax=Desulfotalea psychrophila (strain LSv54 / DSM 12343) TaxID=177439 RepID=Q6ARI4_DESPS|nr:unknown protein [Desulfotalea psychrophila LSv54]
MKRTGLSTVSSICWISPIEKEMKKFRTHLEKLVDERTQELQKALNEIKTLEEIVPICLHCKKNTRRQGPLESLAGIPRKTLRRLL